MKTVKKPREYIYIILTENQLDFNKLQSLHENATLISCSVTGDKKGRDHLIKERNDPQILGFTQDKKIENQFQNVKLLSRKKARFKYQFKAEKTCPADALQKSNFSLFLRHVKHIQVDSINGSDELRTSILNMNTNLIPLNNHLHWIQSPQWEGQLKDICTSLYDNNLSAEAGQILRDVVNHPVNGTHHEKYSKRNIFKFAFIVLTSLSTLYWLFTNWNFAKACIYLFSKNPSFKDILPHLLDDEDFSKEIKDAYISQVLEAVERRGLTNAAELLPNLTGIQLIQVIATFLVLSISIYLIFNIKCRWK